MNAKTKKAIKEIAPKTGDVVQISPMMIIDAAVERGTPVEILEKMFDLYERDQALIASREFDAALSSFQGSVKAIQRVKKADRYWYAPFEKVMEVIRPCLIDNGLSVRFSTKYEQDGYLTTYCTVAHIGGHKEVSEFMCPVDSENKQRINVAQQQGSANSYGKRYAISNALNLVYVDEDDDGDSAGTEYITENDAANLEALISEVGADAKMFLKWAKAPSLDQIKKPQLANCIARLEEKR